MFDTRAIALIHTDKVAKTEQGRVNQMCQCAMIDGYLTANGEVSRFISKLYREKNPNASIINAALQPLFAEQTKKYGKMTDELNNLAEMEVEP